MIHSISKTEPEDKSRVLNNFKLVYGVTPLTSGRARYLPFGVAGEVRDLFPQYLQFVVKNSKSLLKAINKKGTFLFGAGFEDEALGKIVINKKGQKLNDLLLRTCIDIAMYNNFAWHITYNARAQVTSIDKLGFEKVRICEPDEDGEIRKLAYLHQYNKFSTRASRVTYVADEYDIFDADSETVKNQIRRDGGVYVSDNELVMDYKGQILYFQFGDSFGEYYTSPCYLPTLQDAENEYLLSVSKKSDIESGFKSKVILTKIGNANPDEATRQRDAENYQNSVGVEGSSMFLEYAQDVQSKTQVDVIQTPDLAKSYQYAEESISKNIESMFGIPKDLISHSEGSDFLGDSEKIRRLFDFLQKTELNPVQQSISETFAKVFANWRTPIQSEFKIKQIQIL
jgi:hypothetical protein